MTTRFSRLRTILGMAIALAISGSIALVPISASAGAFTLTCTQTGATATPYSLSVGTEVFKESAKECGGALTIPEGAETIGFGAFVPWTAQNTPMTNGNITSILIPNTLTTIWVGGFVNLTSVTQLVIPASVTTIQSQALQGMSSLQNVRIEGSSTSTPTTIGYNALGLTHPELALVFGAGKVVLGGNFGASSQIGTLDLGSGMLSIGTNAFYQQEFSDLTIPPSVTTIDAQAFASMPNVHEIKFGATTPGITSIHASAFSGTNITSVQYCGRNTVLDSYLAANLPTADVYCDAAIAPNTPAVSNATAGDGYATVAVTPGADNTGPAPRNYSIQYSSDATNWTTYVRTPASSSTSVTVPNLSNETAYTFRVAAINPGGTSAYSTASSSATPRAPRFGITYAAGTGTGTLPTDSNVFLPGASATLLPATLLTKDNFTFAGWSNGTTVYQPGNSYVLGSSNATLTAQWVQNSLFGITPSDLTLIGSLTAGGIDTSIGGATGNNGSVSVSYQAGALTTGTVIRLHYLANSTTRATNLLTSTPSFIISFVVSWLHELTGTVPNTAPNKALTMTITNTLIKKGASAFSLVGNTSTWLGTATVDGSITILITEDPEIVIAVNKPDSPTAVAATSGNAASTITWMAPTNNGGGDITSYLVSSSGGQTCFSVTLSCSISGLTNGTPYTFTVRATNSSGASAASSASAAITPAAQSQAGVPAVPTLPVPVVKAPSTNVTSAAKAVASQFSPGSSVVTKVVRAQVLSMLKKISPIAKSVTCTGFTTGPTVLKSDAKLSLNRAKAVCKLIAKLHPKLKIISAIGQQETRLGGAVRRVEVAFKK